MENKRKYVIPGDVVTTGPFRPEQNVVLEGNKIISTLLEFLKFMMILLK